MKWKYFIKYGKKNALQFRNTFIVQAQLFSSPSKNILYCSMTAMQEKLVSISTVHNN